MFLRHFIIILLFSFGLAACAGEGTSSLPTLVPTIALDSQPEADESATPTAVPPNSLSTTFSYTPSYDLTDCEKLLDAEISSDFSIECGFVTVPEDRYNETEGTIRLAVARVFSTSPNPNATPVIFLPGGPGSPVLNSLDTYYADFIAPMQAERDIILFDPRGVGFSEPSMDCWGLKLTYLRDLSETFSDVERTEKYSDALFNCRDRFREDGIQLGAYHSSSIAADVNDILQVMGYSKVHLFGVSYGTRLAQQVMQDYPDLVETAVLDSVVPTSTQLVTKTATWPDEARQLLFAACAHQPACQSSYPDLETVYQNLQTSMVDTPIPLTFTDPVLGNEIEIMASPATLDSALQWALPNPYLSPLVPKMLYDLRNGDGNLLSSAIRVPLLTYEDISLGMMISVLCHDQVSGLTAEQLAAGPEAYPQLSILNTVAFYDNGRFLLNLCQEWGAIAESGSQPPVQSDIPTLILAGQLDTTTPPDFGLHVAETLSQSTFIELPDQGHVPSFGPAATCIQETVQAFFNSPAEEPAYTCQIEQTQATFFTPYDGREAVAMRPFTADDLPFTVMVPADWEVGDYHHFYWFRFPGDYTHIAVQASPVTIRSWLNFLYENYAGSGLTEFPKNSGEINVNGRNWEIHTTTFDNRPVTLAFSQQAGMIYHVALASENQEHEALYENVLLPILASITPE